MQPFIYFVSQFPKVYYKNLIIFIEYNFHIIKETIFYEKNTNIENNNNNLVIKLKHYFLIKFLKNINMMNFYREYN